MTKAEVNKIWMGALVAVGLAGTHEARAACATPAGVAGQLQWISADSKVKFCDGTNWKDTTQSTGASCAGAAAGTINYSVGALQYCNGTNWITMNSGTSLGSCSGTTTGTFNWNGTTWRVCNGTNWYDLAAPTCGGVLYGGYCWYHGADSQSCDTVCTGHGSCESTGTNTFGVASDANCQGIIAAVGFSISGFVQRPTYPTACMTATATSGGARGGAAPTSTCAGTLAGIRRLCACTN